MPTARCDLPTTGNCRAGCKLLSKLLIGRWPTADCYFIASIDCKLVFKMQTVLYPAADCMQAAQYLIKTGQRLLPTAHCLTTYQQHWHNNKAVDCKLFTSCCVRTANQTADCYLPNCRLKTVIHPTCRLDTGICLPQTVIPIYRLLFTQLPTASCNYPICRQDSSTTNYDIPISRLLLNQLPTANYDSLNCLGLLYISVYPSADYKLLPGVYGHWKCCHPDSLKATSWQLGHNLSIPIPEN